MEITTRETGDVIVVDLSGRLDTQTSGSAADELSRVTELGKTKILLNLSDLEFISSAGLRVLLRTAKLVQGANGKVMVCHANGVVKEVMELSGFESFLQMHETEEGALADF